jgi:hypothetical protein
MTYITGGDIQALDYNTFATLGIGMNEVFGDDHPGVTTLPNAGFGYGQTPVLTSVSIGNVITAAQWSALFQTIRKSGAHQGTTVVPPLPASDPVTGDVIEAYNTPSTLATLVALIRTNRFNLAVGQSTLTAGTTYAQPGAANPWTNTLTWNYQVNFGSWNNARYFFNSGGKINLNGSNPTVVTPEDIQWNAMLTAMSPLVFNYTSTTPNTGSGGTAIGFYDLTTSYQTIYLKTYGGGGYYSTSSITVQAKYNAAAGTNGLVDFRIILDDNDPTPNPKTSTTSYRVDNVRATGANIAYPGTISVATVGANSGFVAT